MKSIRYSIHFIVIATVLWALLAAPMAAHADTFTVTSLADDSTAGTLRYEIAIADTGGTINFNVTGTITLTQGVLVLNRAITIVGPGASKLTIDGNQHGDIFSIAGSPISISGMTLTHGLVNHTLYPTNTTLAGGAIYDISAQLTLDQMVITANTVNCASPCTNSDINGTGGAISSQYGASLTVTNSSITNNISTGGGGGIWFGGTTGTLTLTNDSISGNQATDSTYGDGGGVNSTGSATLSNVTVSNNTAAGTGGGLGCLFLSHYHRQ